MSNPTMADSHVVSPVGFPASHEITVSTSAQFFFSPSTKSTIFVI